MNKTLAKDTIREIKKSLGRFISIFAIVAIGVAFFAGVKAAAPDMKYTADKYYDDYNLFDLRVVTTMGLTKDDVNEIQEVPGISGIYPTHSIDVVSKFENTELVFKVHGLLTDDRSTDNTDYINQPKLVEGRLPESSGECVIENSYRDSSSLDVGSKIILESGKSEDITNSLRTKEYTIVGTVDTPYYLSYEKGTSEIGSGSISNYIMIPENDFIMDYYTDVYLTVENAKSLNSYNDKYFDVVDKVKTKIESIGDERSKLRLDEIKEEALRKLNDGKDEYEINKIKFDKEINDANEKITLSEKELREGEINLEVQEAQLPITIKNIKDKISNGEDKVNKGEKEYLINLNKFNDQKSNLEETIKYLNIAVSDLRNSTMGTGDIITQLLTNLSGINNINSMLNTMIETMLGNSDRNEIANSLEVASNDINKQLIDGEKQLEDAKLQIESGKRELIIAKDTLAKVEIDGAKALEDGKNKIQHGYNELENGKKELERNKLLGEEQLKEAKEKIDISEKRIDEISPPEWMVLDRQSHYSYMDYKGAADRIDAIAKVFPLFFFLVAALVCLTTMTRMVDEQRSTIGTLKALGYSKGAIASKYIIYAAIASISGSIVGLTIGMILFPIVIFNAWGIMYTLPSIELRFDPILACGSTLITVLITTSAAFIACYKGLIETPSLLMRPRSPKVGKRILLERINFIWSRFSFTEKVTARNIFRYKKRFFMTVIGISGCTALLLAGFGIKDSIKTIAEKQFGEILKYDSHVYLKDDIDLKDKEKLLEKYSKDERVLDLMKISKFNGNVACDGDDKRVNLIVPSDIEKFKDFTVLRERKNKKDVLLNDSGIILSEKLAREIGVSIGDEISIDNGDGYKKSIKISGVIEMYVDNYVYMTPKLYKSTYNMTPDFNSIVIKVKDADETIEKGLGSDLMNENAVRSVSFYSGIVENFDNTIASLNYVVIVLIISAGALAFVVLYNLTNVNISERLREIATIKVLGFYDNEVSAYVYRENIILSIIGSLVGLGLGTALHRFIMITVELEGVMFGRNINFISYIYGIAITLIFAILVNLVMYYKLKGIPMVESLKSVE